MGGQTGSTLQGNNSQLSQLFGNGYQQTNQVAPITQPQAQTQLLPTPEQAAAATQARMLARTPTMAAPSGAPKRAGDSYIRGGGANR